MAGSKMDFEVADPDIEKAIIQQVMKENNLDPNSVPSEPHIEDPSDPESIRDSKRYFNTRGSGKFTPDDEQETGCHRTWSSAHSWSVMDLKEQEICYRYWQKCKKCEKEVKSVYDKTSIRRMAEWACNECLIRMGLRRREQRSDEDDPEKPTPPHDIKRCEMCKRKGRKCC